MFEPEKISHLRIEATELLKKHGLHDWSFNFDGAKRRLGYCRPDKKLISMSARISYLNEPYENTMTLLHEVAHALTPNEHHGEVWKAKCLEIGGNGEIYGHKRPLRDHEIPQDFADWAKIQPAWFTKYNRALIGLEKWRGAREKAERMENKYFKKVQYYQKKHSL